MNYLALNNRILALIAFVLLISPLLFFVFFTKSNITVFSQSFKPFTPFLGFSFLSRFFHYYNLLMNSVSNLLLFVLQFFFAFVSILVNKTYHFLLSLSKQIIDSIQYIASMLKYAMPGFLLALFFSNQVAYAGDSESTQPEDVGVGPGTNTNNMRREVGTTYAVADRTPEVPKEKLIPTTPANQLVAPRGSIQREVIDKGLKIVKNTFEAAPINPVIKPAIRLGFDEIDKKLDNLTTRDIENALHKSGQTLISQGTEQAHENLATAIHRTSDEYSGTVKYNIHTPLQSNLFSIQLGDDLSMVYYDNSGRPYEVRSRSQSDSDSAGSKSLIDRLCIEPDIENRSRSLSVASEAQSSTTEPITTFIHGKETYEIRKISDPELASVLTEQCATQLPMEVGESSLQGESSAMPPTSEPSNLDNTVFTPPSLQSAPNMDRSSIIDIPSAPLEPEESPNCCSRLLNRFVPSVVEERPQIDTESIEKIEAACTYWMDFLWSIPSIIAINWGLRKGLPIFLEHVPKNSQFAARHPRLYKNLEWLSSNIVLQKNIDSLLIYIGLFSAVGLFFLSGNLLKVFAIVRYTYALSKQADSNK